MKQTALGLGLFALGIWVGVSYGYTNAMQEVRDTQGAGFRTVAVLRDVRGPLYVLGDPKAANEVEEALDFWARSQWP